MPRASLPLLVVAFASACMPPVQDHVTLELTHRADVAPLAAERMEELTFMTREGDTVSAYLRRPASVEEPLAGVVLVAGRETGREAARVVPGPLEVVVLAIEYPDALPDELTVGALLRSLAEVRASALRMPGIIRGVARILADEPEVDDERLALVGVSFGVPFAAAAGADPILRGVALHHGGGDLYRIFDRNLPVESGVLRSVSARFLAWYLGPLDPARHVGAIGPTPLLLVNGSYDDQVPREAALRLSEEAEGPVRHVWLPHDHLMPGDTALMRELADSTLSHFEFLPDTRRARETP